MTETTTATPVKKQRHVFGRLTRIVEKQPPYVSQETGDKIPPVLAVYCFELRVDGLHARKRGSPKRKEKVWSFKQLSNGVEDGQFTMFV